MSADDQCRCVWQFYRFDIRCQENSCHPGRHFAEVSDDSGRIEATIQWSDR